MGKATAADPGLKQLIQWGATASLLKETTSSCGAHSVPWYKKQPERSKQKAVTPTMGGNFANWCMSHDSFYQNLLFSHLEASAKDIF